MGEMKYQHRKQGERPGQPIIEGKFQGLFRKWAIQLNLYER